MDPHSLERLEYQALKQMLARRTQTPIGQDRALALVPSTAREEVLGNLRRTTEGVRFLRSCNGFGLAHLTDPREALRLLRVEDVWLEPKQILELLAWLEAGDGLKARFAGLEPDYPHLMNLIRGLPEWKRLWPKVRGKLTPDGEVEDRASPELKSIRHEILHCRQRLQKRLLSILRGTSSDIIQDELVTIRNDRFVIPIRVEQKGHFSGVIHAASSSGATVFVEPLETIELNNQLVELREREQAEIGRILLEVSNALRAEWEALDRQISLLTEIDLVAARARLAIDFTCCEPRLEEGYDLVLTDARHVMLEQGLQGQGQSPVPITVRLDESGPVMVISGPNAGGKTVALKTVGLAALMAQSGMHVPARQAVLPLFNQILADIGDQQSIVANLSTFTAHIQNVVRMAEILSPPALVLLDEVGTGTDPEEGAALAVALVDYFRGRGALVMATTHYQALKTYAQLTPGIVNAAVEFDEVRLQPTFRLLQGLAGSSSGIEIARRMGLSAGVVAHARGQLRSVGQDASEYLRVLKAELDQLESTRTALEAERNALNEKSQAMDRDHAQKEEHRQKTFEARLRAALDEYQEQARSFLGELMDRKAQLSLQRTVDRQVTRLKTNLGKKLREERGRSLETAGTPAEPEPVIDVGCTVRLLDLDRTGTVLSLDGNDAVVEIGPLRFKTRRDNLEVISGTCSEMTPRDAHPGGVTVELTARPESAWELNVIGCTVEEALERVDKFLDEASLGSLHTVRIIHGVGTGALRTALRTMFATHPHVAGHHPGGDHPSEAEAVTIVELKQD